MEANVFIDELRSTLQALRPGECAEINYKAYGLAFPPGEPNEGARAVCHDFAKGLGCRIENKMEAGMIWFVKDA